MLLHMAALGYREFTVDGHHFQHVVGIHGWTSSLTRLSLV